MFLKQRLSESRISAVYGEGNVVEDNILLLWEGNGLRGTEGGHVG